MSSRTRLALALCVAFAGAGLWSSPAYAQSAISGVVKDETGAVMPGVSVEAASEALIEKVRTAVTDENGAYRMIDLRPGNYKMTFTLQGFNVVIREARAAVELRRHDQRRPRRRHAAGIGHGLRPVAAGRRAEQRQAAGADAATCSTRCRPPGTIQGLGQLVPGVTFDQPDVGGSRAMQQTYFFVRGTGSAQTVVMVDGLMTNGLMGDGAVNAYHNEAMTQEAVYMTSGGNAETMTAGVNLNLVPKDGGNRFTGGFKYAKSPASWQGDNLTDELEVLQRPRGRQGLELLGDQRRARRSDPAGTSCGSSAPTARRRYDKSIANTYDLPAGVPAAGGLRRLSRTAGAAASRASRPRRWTTRSGGSPGRCRRRTSSPSTTTAPCACAPRR